MSTPPWEPRLLAAIAMAVVMTQAFGGRHVAHAAGAAPDAVHDAAVKYQSLFGNEEQKVAARRVTKDDAQFAIKLMEMTKSLSDAPELVAVMCDKAYVHGCKDPDGYAAAAAALKRLEELRPAQAAEWNARTLDLNRLISAHGTIAQRNEAGQARMADSLHQADACAANHQYGDAIKRYKEALSIAVQIRAPSEGIAALIRENEVHLQIAERAAKLQAEFSGKPSEATGKQIVALYVLELDDPASAQKAAATLSDSATRSMVPLAARDPKSLSEDETLKLAEWYKGLGMRATGPGKVIAFSRSMTYMAGYLAGHEKHDAGRLKADQERATLFKLLGDALVNGKRAVVANRVVVWNCHNWQGNNFGASKFNLVLKLRGEIVWRNDDIEIPWEANKDMFAAVDVPAVTIDAVAVEVTAWHAIGPALSEIQVFRGNANLALGMAATVSSSHDPQNPERYPGSTLTDGITTSAIADQGYWLGPDGKLAVVEVQLVKQH